MPKINRTTATSGYCVAEPNVEAIRRAIVMTDSPVVQRILVPYLSDSLRTYQRGNNVCNFQGYNPDSCLQGRVSKSDLQEERKKYEQP